MRAKVDPDKCIGCELCANTCPSIFQMNGGIAVAKTTPVPATDEAPCREAQVSCPVEAISLEE